MNARNEKEKARRVRMNKQLLTGESDGIDAGNDTLALEGGKSCLDVAKLVFAGVILAGIMKEDADTVILYSTGVLVVVFFVVFGFYLIRKSKKTRR